MSPISRRHLMQAGSLSALGAALSRGTAWGDTAWADTDPPPNPTHPAPSAQQGPAHRRAEAAPVAPFTAPYSITASSVLAEDIFLTDAVVMGDPADVVRAFQASDGTVAALVVAAGQLAYLHQDTSNSSGWDYSVLTGQDGGLLTDVADVAVGTHSDGSVWAVVATSGGAAWTLITQDGNGEWLLDQLPAVAGTFGGSVGPLYANNDAIGYLYFSAFYQNATQFIVFDVEAASEGVPQPFQVLDPLHGQNLGDSPRLLWSDNTPRSGNGVLAPIVGDTSSSLVWYPQVNANGQYGPAVTWNVDVQHVLWTDAGTANQPGPRVLTQWGGILQGLTDGTPFLTGVVSDNGVQQTSVWFNDDTFAVAVVTDSQQLQITSITDDLDAQFVPLVNDVVSATSCSSDPEEATLFVVLADLTLNILTKRPVTNQASGQPVSAWSMIPVQQTAATGQPIDAWRTQLTVLDANGVPVGNTQLQITPDRAVGCWQPGGHLLIDPAHPATLTTDSFGRLTIALATTEIDGAFLSVQIFQSGTPSGSPVVVNPAAGVHAFLSGTAPLNNVGPLNGPALLAAQNAQGTALFPMLNNLSGSDQTNAAAGVSTALTRCMAAAQTPTPGPDDPQSFVLDMTATVPTYAESTDPNHFPPLTATGALGGWWDTVKHDAESVYHAVRHGLVQVGKCLATFASGQWLINLAVSIGNDISDVISYAITDIRSAIHAVSGFFQKLGADIKDVVHWLKLFFGDLLGNAEKNTQTLLGWINLWPSQIAGGLTKASEITTGFFAGQKEYVNNMITERLLPNTAGVTMGGGTGASVVPPTELGSFDLHTVVSDVEHNWLFEKIFAELDLLLGGGDDTHLGGLLDDLIEAMIPTTLLGELAENLWTVMKEAVENAADINSFSANTLVTGLQNLIDDILAYFDNIVQTMIALLQAAAQQVGSFLDTNLVDTLPLLSGIFEHFGIGGSLTIGHVFGLVFMFPATVAHSIITGSDGLMFQQVGLAKTGVGAGQDLLARDLKITHGVIRAFNGIFQVVVDIIAFGDSQLPPGERKAPLKYASFVDAITTLAVQVLVYPGEKLADGSTAPPCTTPPTIGLDKIGLETLFKMIFGAVNPLLGICLSIAKITANANYTIWWPISRSMLAAVNLSLGISIDVQEGKTDPLGFAALAVEMSNLIVSPLTAAALNDENVGVPLAVKGVSDLAQIAAGGLYIADALKL